MPFALEDTYRCLKVLGLPPNRALEVNDRLIALEAQSEFLVTQVKDDLTGIEAVERNLIAETGSANFAIVQASVLQYAENKRVMGMLMQMYLFSLRIGTYLEIKPELTILEGMLRMLGVALPSTPVFIARLERS